MTDPDDIARLRIEYGGAPLRARDAGDSPAALFQAWFDAAKVDSHITEANAMALGTAGIGIGIGTGAVVPSVRMVLLKAFDPAATSFTWHTNLDSRKAREIAEGGSAALCWWWPGQEWSRQVRAVGLAEPVDRATSQRYFDTRAPEARIGAASSHQSRAVTDRADLEERVARMTEPPGKVPNNWGGIRLVADELEFWQGRAGRLHDRITFLRLASDGTIASPNAVEAAGGDSALRAAATQVVDAHGTRWLRARLEP